ncbi:MAG TPA: alpha/beta hydrolase [Kofleriaceae bacterium]|nr:alpha/beta hydrolase [Kofleriaceae bacterium]
MDLFFCHGLETGPHGRKYQALAAADLNPIAPDFQGMALAARVAVLRPLLAASPDAVVVGSSYGGITALCAAIQVVNAGGSIGGLVLCAPALGRNEPPADQLVLRAPAPTTIIHGLRDQIVPVAVSRDFARANPTVRLIEVDDEHRLVEALPLIVDATRAMIATAAAARR